MTVRDHTGIVLDKFNGLYNRGNIDETPSDHFSDCLNVDYIANYSFETRPGIGISQTVSVPLSNIKRVYNYPTQTANTLIILAVDDSNLGSIYHFVNPS